MTAIGLKNILARAPILVIPSEVEEWSGSGNRDIDEKKAE